MQGVGTDGKKGGGALHFLESYKEAKSSLLMTFHYYSPKMLGPSAAPVVELNYVPIQKKS